MIFYDIFSPFSFSFTRMDPEIYVTNCCWARCCFYVFCGWVFEEWFMLFMYVYVVYIIFIACCQNLMILFNVVYFVFAAFLLDTLFGSCFIYFSKMFVNWCSRTGGRVEILCKLFFQWFLHSKLNIYTYSCLCLCVDNT